ncbi:MAG: hypothetical protein AAF928_05540 [Myxococcota bacterium]
MLKNLLFPTTVAALAVAGLSTLDTPAEARDTALSQAERSEGVAAEPRGATELGAGTFDISVGNAQATVGEAATISVTVTAKGGFKCNDAYPHRVKKLAGTGVTFPQPSVTGAVSGKSIQFSIPVTPTEAGAHAVTGQVKFSVCNDESCHIKKVPLQATVTGT